MIILDGGDDGQASSQFLATPFDPLLYLSAGCVVRGGLVVWLMQVGTITATINDMQYKIGHWLKCGGI